MPDNLGMASSADLRSPAPQSATQPAASGPFLLQDKGGDEGGVIGGNTIARTTPDGVDVLPIIHPDRQRPAFNVAKAWHHFRIYIKDKEQTDQVIAVFDNLPWRALHDEAAKFLSTPRGRQIYQDEPYLPDFLDDHDALRRTPKGSFAHAYCDFMEREGLTAAGMVEASSSRLTNGIQLNDGVSWYIDRLRDFHDILHIVTGYGRDLLGEQCIFAYMYHQRPSPGHLMLAWAGTLMMRAKIRTNAPIIGALREARSNGKQCPRIVEMPIQKLFEMPLEEVRATLNTPPPHVYNQVLKTYETEGIDPHAFMAKA